MARVSQCFLSLSRIAVLSASEDFGLQYGKRSRSTDLHERHHRAATSNMAIARPTGNFTMAPLLPARGTVARRNNCDPCRGGRACSAGPMELRIGRGRQTRNSRWICILSVDYGIVLCCGQRRKTADQRGRRETARLDPRKKALRRHRLPEDCKRAVVESTGYDDCVIMGVTTRWGSRISGRLLGIKSITDGNL